MHSIHPSAVTLRVATLLAAFAMFAAHPAAGAAREKQKVFATPQQAVQELAAAAKANDGKALLAVLGADATAIVFSGDAVADRTAAAEFAQVYEETNRIEMQSDSKAVLMVGKDDWPLPFPLVKSEAGWRFDARQGREEVLTRRIGHNELAAIQVMQAYVDAQEEYYLRNPGKQKLLHYAQKAGSSKGKRDGLYYPVDKGEPPSPLGSLFAKAQTEGYRLGSDSGKPVPYHGYLYRILKAQGPEAKNGAYSYVVRGTMIGGFALAAYPAAYGKSGVMTFLVNHDGIVYEKDLGPSTGSIAAKMSRFNPDSTWKRP